MRVLAYPYPLLLLVLWTGVLGLGDFVVAEASVRQYLSSGFAATKGKILRSKLDSGAVGSRGIDFSYKYTVKGTDYFGWRYRYDDRHIAFDYKAVARVFVAGTTQKVYYNPANPSESVLSPGLAGGNYLLVLFAIPLNVVTLAIWLAVFRAWRKPQPFAPAGGVRILRKSHETRARLVEFPPWEAGFMGLAVASFAASMVIAFRAGFAPSLEMMHATFALVAACGIGIFAWTAQRHHHGRCDLRMDDGGKTLVLPPAAGRRQPLTISRRDTLAVWMCRRVHHGPGGKNISYLPALDVAQDGQTRRLVLVDRGWPQQKAQAFADWLSQQLGVPFGGVED